MTEGRFETVMNVRPANFDGRPFWAHRHGFDHAHAEDHRMRESCPFHDLRADGCFQPEYHGHGDRVGGVLPEKLTRRPVGKRFGTGRTTAKGRGVGGHPLPLDTAAAPPGKPRAVSAHPWTTTKKGGVFSDFPHMPGGPAVGPPPPGALPPVPFGAGKRPGLFSTFEHIPPGGAPPAAPPVARLATGKPRGPKPFEYLPCGPPLKPEAASRDNRIPIKREPYRPRNWHLNALGRHPFHIPDPEPAGETRNYRPPIFTYATKTKRDMPISTPWTTGPQTAEPNRPPADE